MAIERGSMVVWRERCKGGNFNCKGNKRVFEGNALYLSIYFNCGSDDVAVCIC